MFPRGIKERLLPSPPRPALEPRLRSLAVVYPLAHLEALYPEGKQQRIVRAGHCSHSNA